MMAYTLSQITSSTPTPRNGNGKGKGGLRRSFSNNDLQRRGMTMRRSYSDNHISHSITSISIKASVVQQSKHRSLGFFNIPLPDTLKSFLFDPETTTSSVEENDEDEDEMQTNEVNKRANWIERLLELRSNWKVEKKEEEEEEEEDKVESQDGGDQGCEGGGCEIEYEEDEGGEDGKDITIDSETFSSLLTRVSWSDTKHFSQLAFLCNMAYVIRDMKKEDLRRYSGLELVTSSLEKKTAAAAAMEQDDTVRVETPEMREKTRLRSSTAYDIAASAASYVQSREKEEEEGRVYKSEMAASVAASTMTAVVGAGEKQREQAAKDLQSLHSSPCEWFVCDDSTIYTRRFVIQGSDSLASWQANLFFEPTKFEGTHVLVHRGIYEAAKGMYDQFMPLIKQHLDRFGDRAKLQFTGHSLGGSLALLVNLMLLTRNQLKPSSLLPVVSFGAPFVFCGGHKILEQLRLDDNHVQCVMMHRDIVPRAFSCNYPTYVAQILKRMNPTFRSHPCLNKNKLLYSPMGKIFILQPDEKVSPPHPLLPSGSALHVLDNTNRALTKTALRTFLNSPHPIETLSDPKAYGSEGKIIRDHDSSNYLKAVNGLIKQRTRLVAKKHRNHLWPLITSRSPHAWNHSYSSNMEDRPEVNKELLTGV